jgi:hypothetical protein
MGSFAKNNCMQSKNEQKAINLQIIPRWQQSGLSQKAFCAANNIAYHSFHYWYRVYKATQKHKGAFLPVNITSPDVHEQITITAVSGIKLQFELSDRSVRFIRQLLLS